MRNSGARSKSALRNAAQAVAVHVVDFHFAEQSGLLADHTLIADDYDLRVLGIQVAPRGSQHVSR